MQTLPKSSYLDFLRALYQRQRATAKHFQPCTKHPTMRPTGGLFALTAFCLGVAAKEVQIFNGTGQLRTLWRDGDHADLGCLTDQGRWTTDDSKCGTFEATPDAKSPSLFTLKSSAGFCKVYGAKFVCEEGNEPLPFGVGGRSTHNYEGSADGQNKDMARGLAKWNPRGKGSPLGSVRPDGKFHDRAAVVRRFSSGYSSGYVQ